jgi:hypothetical protein
MDERDDAPIPGRSAERLLLIAMGGALAATSPIWVPAALALYLHYTGEDGLGWLLAAGCVSIGAFAVWLVVRFINRHDSRRAKPPPDPF